MFRHYVTTTLQSHKQYTYMYANFLLFPLIAGIVYVYGVFQLNVWAMFHAIGLCWAIVFPFHYRNFKADGKIKYIHIVTVIFGLLFPFLPALLYLNKGYAALFTPTRVCTGRSLRVTYFSFLLPSSIILATTTFALIVVFWTILKVSVHNNICVAIYHSKYLTLYVNIKSVYG